MRLRANRLREDLRNIFVTAWGFAHLLCQKCAITLSKNPVLGLFWRNNFVTLQNVCGLTGCCAAWPISYRQTAHACPLACGQCAWQSRRRPLPGARCTGNGRRPRFRPSRRVSAPIIKKAWPLPRLKSGYHLGGCQPALTHFCRAAMMTS